MKLNYRILWFEDDDEVIKDTHGPAIEDYIRSVGLNPIIDHHLNGNKLDSLVKTDKINSYDLIVSDLDLGDGKQTGQDLIHHLRVERIFTDVLLYSASDKAMEKVIAGSWVERASFCIGVGPLRDKIKGLIRLTLNKQQDVNNTRGLFIAETIVLEKKIERLVLDYFTETEGLEMPADKLKQLASIRDKRVEGNQKQAAALAALEKIDLESLINDGVINAAHTTMALISVFKARCKALEAQIRTLGSTAAEVPKLQEQLNEAASLKEELTKFQAEILSIRNTLAHVEELTDEEGTPYLASRQKGGATIRFEPREYVQMRLDLRRHSDNLDKIMSHMASEK